MSCPSSSCASPRLFKQINQRPTSMPHNVTDLDVYQKVKKESFPYKRLSLIGRGIFTTVHIVENTKTRKKFACKIVEDLYDDLSTTDLVFKRVANDQVAQLYQLRGHPHIIDIIEAFHVQREFFVIMDPIAEIDLHHLLLDIRDGKRARDDYKQPLLKAFGCLSSALAFIHGKGIRHRDITPRNVLYSNGSCIYSAFGISRMLKETSGFATYVSSARDGYASRYCPPESIDRSWHKSLSLEVGHFLSIDAGLKTMSLLKDSSFLRDARSDVFSLGCTFYEILATLEETLRFLPFNRCYYTEVKVLQKNLKEAACSANQIQRPLKLCTMMISEAKDERPLSTGLVPQLLDPTPNFNRLGIKLRTTRSRKAESEDLDLICNQCLPRPRCV